MAEHHATWTEQGHVLWGVLVMLGMMAELSLTCVQLAAQEGLSVSLLEQRAQQRQRMAVIAEQVAGLPIPARDSPVIEPWHPEASSVTQCCGRDGGGSPLTVNTPCGSADLPLLTQPRASGDWRWRLTREADDPAVIVEGTDMSEFPGLQPQSWQLQVVVAGRAGTRARGLWQRYQQVSP